LGHRKFPPAAEVKNSLQADPAGYPPAFGKIRGVTPESLLF
jgi:hypothetical protein